MTKTDIDILMGATIVDVNYSEEEGFVEHVVLRTKSGKTFTMTGWAYVGDPNPLVIKEGVHFNENGYHFKMGDRYE